MADAFDPYYVWLGIPPAEQPANHYRLLAINLFESNQEVIENAADQRMVHLRTFQIGKQADISQRLLNEVAAAKVCLLRPEKKAAYDQQLRQQLQDKAEKAEQQRPELDSQLAAAIQREARKGRGPSGTTPPPGRGAILVAAGAVALLAVIAVVWAVAARKAPVQTAQLKSGVEAPSRQATEGQADKGAEQGRPSPTSDLKSEISNLKSPSPNSQRPSPKPQSASAGASSPAPPLARPSMSAAEAAEIQKQWAAYLGTPVQRTNSIGMPLVLIPPGEFDMGSTPEEQAWALAEGSKHQQGKWYLDRVATESPRHRVKITRPFYLGVNPVTQGEYAKVMGANPSTFTAEPMDASAFRPPLSAEENSPRGADAQKVKGKDTGRHPVETVAWEQAMEFCRKLSAMPAERAGGTGLASSARPVYRLPTEAEWEYSCRAGTTTRWYCGDNEAGLVGVAWFNNNSGGMTHPVGGKRPNAWGLYDMCGNVDQWCSDWYHPEYYEHSPSTDPGGSRTGSVRTLRGGAWTDWPTRCRSAFRYSNGPTNRNHGFGLRVVLECSAAPAPSALAASDQPSKAGPEPQHGSGTAEGRPSPAANLKSEIPGSQPLVAKPVSNPPALLPVPADDLREAAAKAVQDDYRGDYAKANGAAEKLALAKRMLDDASKAPGSAAKRFVLLSAGRDIAIAERDDTLALRAIEELGRSFVLDTWAVESLGRLAKNPRATAARCELAEQTFALALKALDAEKLSAAGELAKLALSEAGRAHDWALAGRARTASKEIQEVLDASSAAEAARAQLKAKPADASAHLALGRYLCLLKGDWEAGLPHLARGDNPELKALAEDDLKHVPLPWQPEAGKQPPAPVPAAAAMKLSDAWWELAEQAKGRQRACLFLRAGYWCEAVAAGPEAGQYATQIAPRWQALGKLAVKVPRARVVVNSIGMPLVFIPVGQFEMGSTAEEVASVLRQIAQASPWHFARIPAEAPPHPVKITRPFYLGIYQVTQAEYEKVMGENPSTCTAKPLDGSKFTPPLEGAELTQREEDRVRLAGRDTSRHPVETINWHDATDFCRRLSAMPAERAARRTYRLPTEAEWEYACRAGTTTRWYSGDDEECLADIAWFNKNSQRLSHPVGQKRPNAWGLYDMCGNAYQWCADWFGGDYYQQSPASDPAGSPKGPARVLRGGSSGEPWFMCRSSARHFDGPTHRIRGYGLRVAIDVARDEGTGVSPSAAAPRPQPAAEKAAPPSHRRRGPPAPAAPSMAADEAAETQRQWAQYAAMPVEETNSLGMPLRLIPPGRFEMGSRPEEQAWALEHGEKNPENQGRVASESPRHPVRISRPFYMAKYLVTQAEFEKVMGVNPSAFAARPLDPSAFPRPLPESEVKIRHEDAKKVAGQETGRRPVETVTWQEAKEFCRRLSALPAERAAGRVYRLPSEAEWEYACRAGTTTRWHSGDDLSALADAAWLKENSGGITHPVGEKKPNAWGLCDMHGNVRQWCADWFGADAYKQSFPSDPTGPLSGAYRVLRGGFCRNDPSALRSASRFHSTPAARGHAFGFRVVAER